MGNNRHSIDRADSGALFSVHGTMHRLLGSVAETVLLSDVASHHLFLVQHADGRLGPPDRDQVATMIDDGIIVPLDATPPDKLGLDRMGFTIGLLDTAGVRNGEKAIWLHLNAVWNDDLRRRFGPFDDPATIRRWRTAHRKAARTTVRMDRPDA